MPRMAKRPSRRPPGTLRIIGGRWRGRRFACPPGEITRPTGDRIRETLFNWLAPAIHGARCLDLFAGTGALGLEALSRGAAAVTFVEKDAVVTRQLEATLQLLDCTDATVVLGDARRFLSGPPAAVDVAFLDPPFDGLNPEILCTLLDDGWLAPDALVYIEMRRGAAAPELPSGWSIIRDKTAGRVRFMLVRLPGAADGDQTSL